MQKKGFIFVGIALVSAGLLLWVFGNIINPESRPAFERSAFALIRQDGTRFVFEAEVAKTKEQQAHGLMYVRSMPDDKGMIFIFSTPIEAVFWMKNTFISLDMLFVRPDQTIGRIAASVQPQDMTPIHSQEPISAVIEINGGLAKKYGLGVGDKVEFPANK